LKPPSPGWKKDLRTSIGAPEARQILAYGETVGMVVRTIQAPAGAAEKQLAQGPRSITTIRHRLFYLIFGEHWSKMGKNTSFC